jgi:nitrate reductase NapAB chaperone NapD
MRVKPRDTSQVMSELKNLDKIVQASAIHGPHDCLVEIQADTLEDVNNTVLSIRSLKGVIDTITCLVVQSWHRSG